ncbi:Fen-1 [Drosophila innubila nudivirus]|uniref:Fen-1 n=1 Tax=Drosophila innubila nudivirus TaxID=2057187 RepID=A0A2H4UXC1_9VIRU|nr:Fen-1 [Drosophila innubila nudivirus]ATZ81559.1 Fen-1 [Drosophila innubila nudivirus]
MSEPMSLDPSSTPLKSPNWFGSEYIDDYEVPNSSIYSSATLSCSHVDFKPLQFQSTFTSDTYTQPSRHRKRIYGDEFKELTMLNVQPQSKLLKLDQPQHQILSSNDIDRPYNMPLPQFVSISQLNDHNTLTNNSNGTSENIITNNELVISSIQSQEEQLQQHLQIDSSKIPTPTITQRNYITKYLDYNSIPKICDNCFCVGCICRFSYY